MCDFVVRLLIALELKFTSFLFVFSISSFRRLTYKETFFFLHGICGILKIIMKCHESTKFLILFR